MCFHTEVIERAAERQVLSIGEIERLARGFKGLHNLNCSGGEPFLRDDFADIPQLFYRHSGTRFITCTTNSSRPAHIEAVVRQLCERCPRAWIRVVQSLDGIGEKHDSIRQKPGLFERVLELNGRLGRLARRMPNLGISIATALSSFNRDHVYELLDYAYENLSFDDMGALWVRGQPHEPAARLADTAFYRRFQQDCIRRIYQRRASRTLAGRAYTAMNQGASQLLMQIIATEQFVAPCVAGRRMVVMDDEGTVRPCEMLGDFIDEGKITLPTAVLGNIRDFDYDIRKLLATDYARRAARTIVKSKCTCSYECALAATVLYTPTLLLEASFKALFSRHGSG